MKRVEPDLRRLKKAYKSVKSPIQIHPERINTVEFSHSNGEMHPGEPPPPDDSVLFESLEPLKHLEIDGINIMSLICSAVSVAELKTLSQMEKGIIPERDGILFPDSDEKTKSIAFNWACFRGLPHLLQKLEASGADIHNVYFNEANTAMISCFSGDIDCLKYVIEKGINVNYINPLNNHSPLHSAAARNHREAAKIVLDNGGMMDIPQISKKTPLLHYAIENRAESVVELFIERGISTTQKNIMGKTPLHVACCVQSVDCCKLLLQKPEVDINAQDLIGRTPLHYAVINSASDTKIVELLLRHGAQLNILDKTGHSALHVAALYEQSECVEALIWKGADINATTIKGVSTLNVILRKVPESFQIFRMKLDSSIRLRRPTCQNREFEMRLDFAPLLPSDEKPETTLINSFIQENQKNLLCHPLIKAFLYLKWEKFRKFYLFSIFLYATSVIFMTAYVLTALAYKCYNFDYENVNNSRTNNDKNLICLLFSKQLIQFEWFMWLILSCLTLPRKLISFGIHKCIHQYYWNTDNLLDAIVILSVFATSYIYTGRTHDWQTYIGAFATLCAWTNLMLKIGQLPTFGTYVAMFTHIQFEFAKLLLAYLGLLIGFAVSFCVIFVHEPSFRNPFTGFIKILAMMAGELDFEVVINKANLQNNDSVLGYYPLYICSQILFSLFVVFIVVILMNLLVGIAVHDIQGLRCHAGLTKLVRMTKLIIYTEMAQSKIKIPPFLKKWLPQNHFEVQNRKHILVVRPLNPLENRLPRDILNEAYEIAQKNSEVYNDDKFDHYDQVPWKELHNGEDKPLNIELVVEKLILQMKSNANEIHDFENQLQDTKKLLEQVISKLS